MLILFEFVFGGEAFRDLNLIKSEAVHAIENFGFWALYFYLHCLIFASQSPSPKGKSSPDQNQVQIIQYFHHTMYQQHFELHSDQWPYHVALLFRLTTTCGSKCLNSKIYILLTI